MKRVALRRKGFKRPKRKKKTQADIWREFGLNRPPKPRYSGLRGILWYVFSLYIRERDKNLPCINCGLMKPERHAGHYIPTGQCGWDGMVFDEMNVHSECSSCNMRDKRKLKYGLNLDKRHPGTREQLERRYSDYRASQGQYKNYSQDEYRARIRMYTTRLSTLRENTLES